MAKKNIMQDVIPPKRSIQNVTLPLRARKLKVEENDEKEKETITAERKVVDEVTPKKTAKRKIKEVAQYSYEYDAPKKPSKTGKYIAFGVVILLAVFGVSALFRGAEIKVTPKQDTIALNTVFGAKKNAGGNELGYQLVTVSKDMEKTVDATGEHYVERKAQGRIVVYNDFSKEPQKLVATTRFQTPEGLIFRTPTDIVIPGQHISVGKTVPGSVEITVVADKSGPDYNIGLKDFAIPGFKNDLRYSKVYGRSKTEITGGFAGQEKSVSADTLKQAEADLETSLKATLSRDIGSQIPENFILYPDSLTFSFDPASQVASGSQGGAVVHKKGFASGVIFDKGILSQAIFAKAPPNPSLGSVKITNLDSLSFSYASAADLKNSTNISFSLKGSFHVVSIFDENKLKSDLLGLSKKDAISAIGKYPAIAEGWITTRPFWSQTIPSDPAKVKLINTLAQ